MSPLGEGAAHRETPQKGEGWAEELEDPEPAPVRRVISPPGETPAERGGAPEEATS